MIMNDGKGEALKRKKKYDYKTEKAEIEKKPPSNLCFNFKPLKLNSNLCNFCFLEPHRAPQKTSYVIMFHGYAKKDRPPVQVIDTQIIYFSTHCVYI